MTLSNLYRKFQVGVKSLIINRHCLHIGGEFGALIGNLLLSAQRDYGLLVPSDHPI